MRISYVPKRIVVRSFSENAILEKIVHNHLKHTKLSGILL